MEENQNQENDFMEEQSGLKSWLQENLRIIISIAIVIIIAGGIYSYAKRSQVDEELNIQEEDQLVLEEESEDAISDDNNTPSENEDTIIVDETENEAKEEPAKQEDATQNNTSKETDGSFIETAQQGEGLTHLARKALADYLEKNPDSQLSAEHKIFIEDYLRKNINHDGKVHVGSTAEFSKDLIKQAIEKSKNLNEGQLKNLQKYSVMVPSLS
jgi:cytoskeletal protein RodZ